MHVVMLASRKGGAGKSTLAAHLSVEAFRQIGGRVAICDCDRMGGLAGWWNERQLDGPEFARIGEGGLAKTLAELRASKAFDVVFIDTPPAADESILALMRLADLIVVPVIPSPNDLRAIEETLDLVEKSGKPLIFVVNNASTSASRLTHQASSTLSQFGTVAPDIVRTRQDFRSSMIDGRVAVEVNPKSKSADEIASLWKYVQSRLERGKRHGRTARVTA